MEAVVTKDIPDYAIFGDNLAKVIKYRNVKKFKELKEQKIFLIVIYNIIREFCEMKYYYIPSYGSIYFPLYSYLKKDDFIVITPNEKIKDFLEFMKIKYYYINNCSIKKPNEFKKILKEIKKLNIKKTDEFYFFHNGYDILGFYLMKKIKAKKFFYDIDPERDFVKFSINKEYLRTLLKKYFIRIFLGIKTDIFKASNYALGIKKSFLLDNDLKPLENSKIINEEKKIFVLKNLDINFNNFHDILYLTQGLEEKNIIKKESLAKLTQEIKKLNLDIKLHPNDKINSFKNITIEQSIPAEFIIKKYKKIISIYSSTLFLAKNYPEKDFISLINLVEWYDESYKKRVRNMLDYYNKNRNIYYPTNFNELINILTDKNYN